MMEEQYQDEEEEAENGGAGVGGVDFTASMGRFYGWPSSRIVRVSRACGGKDRHSKVLTSKGLRDRRVRLSVNTAIQFYDLQDRLGYDQPSKAVEWLLKAAATSINELPPMSILFPDTRKLPLNEEKRASDFDSPEVEMDDGGDPGFSQNVVTRSSSETGSRISASRSGKARKENGSLKASSMNPISHTTSFTELLNAGITNAGVTQTSESNLYMKSSMDYLCSGLLSPAASRANQMQFPANHLMGFGTAAEQNQSELQQLSYPPENLVHAMNNASAEYNMNGSFLGLAGFSRGTLQSNSSSPSLLPHIQRFADGSPPSFFTSTDENNCNHNHQFLAGYDARLQLCYGSSGNQKLSGKN